VPFVDVAASISNANLDIALHPLPRHRQIGRFKSGSTQTKLTMAHRLTLMDGDLVEYQPNSLRTRTRRFPVRASPPKEPPKAEQPYATTITTTTSRNDESEKPKIPQKERLVGFLSDQSARSYYNFMPLDQAGPAVIARDNKDRSFVAIKRAKRSSVDNALRIPEFMSDHVVNIKDMFWDKGEAIIDYEQMDVSLRHIMAVAGEPLQAFEIAAVCKEVSLYLRSDPLNADLHGDSWLRVLLISMSSSQCTMAVCPVERFCSVRTVRSRSVIYALDRY